LLVDEKKVLMQKLGKKTLSIELKQSIDRIPDALAAFNLETSADGKCLTYTYDYDLDERTGITSLLQSLSKAGLSLKDLHTRPSSLEEIFVRLVNRQ
jgi:ABC-2 type transport system ATP-binding protein